MSRRAFGPRNALKVLAVTDLFSATGPRLSTLRYAALRYLVDFKTGWSFGEGQVGHSVLGGLHHEYRLEKVAA